MSEPMHQLSAAVQARTGDAPYDLAIVLGSGLAALGERLSDTTEFPYADFAVFPRSTTAGHPGRLLTGRLGGWRVLAFQGRWHLYEGYSAWQVTSAVQAANALGCRRLLLTNAVGAINQTFRTGDFMWVRDHLNLLGANPLTGLPDAFVDLSRLYEQELFFPLAEFAATQGIRLQRGVLAAVPGPSYETPAEITALERLGADVVSMSTVPEAIMARYLGLQVAALSCIANPAAGRAAQPLSHAEVLAAGQLAGEHLAQLAEELIALWQNHPLAS